MLKIQVEEKGWRENNGMSPSTSTSATVNHMEKWTNSRNTCVNYSQIKRWCFELFLVMKKKPKLGKRNSELRELPTAGLLINSSFTCQVDVMLYCLLAFILKHLFFSFLIPIFSFQPFTGQRTKKMLFWLVKICFFLLFISLFCLAVFCVSVSFNYTSQPSSVVQIDATLLLFSLMYSHT